MTRDWITELCPEIGGWQVDLIVEHIESCIAAEREACAKVCEKGLPIATSLNALDDMELWGERFASAIRNRGEAKS